MAVLLAYTYYAVFIDNRGPRSIHVEFQVHILDTREICRSAFFYFIWPLRCLCRHPIPCD